MNVFLTNLIAHMHADWDLNRNLKEEVDMHESKQTTHMHESGSEIKATKKMKEPGKANNTINDDMCNVHSLRLKFPGQTLR